MTIKGIDERSGRRLSGVLILHGFTANLDSVRELFGPLGQTGLEVSAPLLRGHGQESPEHLRGVTWQDWLEDAEQAMNALAGNDGRVIVIGHSMGALLALHLAARHPELIDSLVLATPPIRLVSPLAPGGPLHFLSGLVSMLVDRWDLTPCFADLHNAIIPENYRWAPTRSIISLFDLVTATLPVMRDVRAPVLVIHGRSESIVMPESADLVMQAISTPPGKKSVVWLEKSDHQVFCDCERHRAVGAVREFVIGRVASSASLQA
jgi:carboxylesterase